MTEHLVSVVMVVCNVDRFLAESIDSILGQTFRDFEFIIVDFGSTDESRSIISRYAATDNRVSLHAIPRCSLAEARNAGCRLAQGRYIAIMDADDVSLPDRLMWQVEFMETHPQVGLLGGATEWIDATGQSIRIDNFPTGDGELRLELALRCAFCQPTVLLRREAFVLAGGYREVFAKAAEDYDLWLRIVEHYQCANLKQVVLKYRIHSNQTSMRKRREQTFGMLAARASASMRMSGKADPLNGVQEITAETLVTLGVSEATQENQLAVECWQWVRHMTMAGEYAVACDAAVGLIQSKWKYVGRWQISELHLILAKLYWKQKRFARSFLSACYAVKTRPVVLGRPLKLWLRRLGL